MIKELAGAVEFFEPKNDPAATAIVDSLWKQMGSPIQSEALKAAGIEVTVRTRGEYEALQEKKKSAKARELAQTVRELINPAFATGFQNFGKNGPNDIVLSINGEKENLVGCEFRDSAGGKIRDQGAGIGYVQENAQLEKRLTYHFDARLPETAKLAVFVATPTAIVKVPFTLANIALP
jgi:hypothetical protein